MEGEEWVTYDSFHKKKVSTMREAWLVPARTVDSGRVGNSQTVEVIQREWAASDTKLSTVWETNVATMCAASVRQWSIKTWSKKHQHKLYNRTQTCKFLTHFAVPNFGICFGNFQEYHIKNYLYGLNLVTATTYVISFVTWTASILTLWSHESQECGHQFASWSHAAFISSRCCLP